MSINALFNQTITLYSQASYDHFGRAVVGTGLGVRARVQAKKMNRFAPNNETIIIDAIIYVPASTVVAQDDRIDYGADKYKVYAIYAVPDGQGQTHHKKLEVKKWQET